MKRRLREDFDPEGLQNLANAVIIQATKDYRKALKDIRKNPKDRSAMNTAMECEDFFEGDWITALTKIDGSWLKEKLRKEVVANESN